MRSWQSKSSRKLYYSPHNFKTLRLSVVTPELKQSQQAVSLKRKTQQGTAENSDWVKTSKLHKVRETQVTKSRFFSSFGCDWFEKGTSFLAKL